MNRILDANLNRSAEALRVLEELARFVLDDAPLSARLKNARHEINAFQERDYDAFLAARDTEGDVGTVLPNSDSRSGPASIFKANIKRLQQALRVLAENAGETALFERLRYESYTLEKEIWAKLCAKFPAVTLAKRRLYLVTNSDAFPAPAAFLVAVESALRGGVDIVQLREKHKPARQILELGAQVRRLCADAGAVFIVNDRVDIACALGADGVHLGQDDMDVVSARKILPAGAIVGVSTHAPEQAQRAVADGADYIGAGPVFTTPTKPGRASVGLEYIRWVSEHIATPAFAIGGIDYGNVGEVLAAGARRLAVVRAIINAPVPEVAVRQFAGMF